VGVQFKKWWPAMPQFLTRAGLPVSTSFHSMDQQAIFAEGEFDKWSQRLPEQAGLDGAEAFLVKNYFTPDRRTLEGGTAGGRVLLALKKMGFTQLYGFDFVPEAIARARQHDLSGTIHFEVMDASRLGYESEFFDQIIYPEQILSFIADDARRAQALREAYRVLRKGGVAVFTTLCLEVRQHSPKHRVFHAYLGVLCRLRRSPRGRQLAPWLRVGGKFHWPALLDAPPYNYWYRIPEFNRDLLSAGFRIESAGTYHQIRQKRLCPSVEALAAEPLQGILYVVCRK
jgi:ubiquinone/menaquinone biosynthesis C-methylase UbiE